MQQYDQQSIVNSFREMLPQIKQASNPASAMLKYASERNLPPAVLEKLAHTFNTAKTLNVMKKATSDEARGQTFELIDTPRLLADYTTWEPPQAAGNGFDDDASGWLEMPLAKAASEQITVERRVPDLTGEACGDRRLDLSLVDEPPPPVKKAAQIRPDDARHELELLRGVIGEATWQLRDRYEEQKSAALRNPRFVNDIYQDMQAVFGAVVHEPLAKFAHYLKGQHVSQEEIVPDDRMVAVDRHKAAAWMEDVLALTDLITGASGLGLHIAKEANISADDLAGNMRTWAGTDDPESILAAVQSATRVGESEPAIPVETVERSETPAAGPRETPPEEAPAEEAPAETTAADTPPSEDDTGTAVGRETSKAPKKPTGGKPKGGPPHRKVDPNLLSGQDLISLVLTDRVNTMYQQQLAEDAAVDELKTSTVLQRLMLTDPILSQADPDQVISQFNTIRQTAPDIARDPNLLTFALREAVQYGGIPIHTYDQMLDTKYKKLKYDDKSKSQKQPINLSLLGI